MIVNSDPPALSCSMPSTRIIISKPGNDTDDLNSLVTVLEPRAFGARSELFCGLSRTQTLAGSELLNELSSELLNEFSWTTRTAQAMPGPGLPAGHLVRCRWGHCSGRAVTVTEPAC